MRSRFHTIVFVPRSEKRTRQFRVSGRWLATAAAAAVLVQGFIGWVTFTRTQSATQLRERARIERENDELRRANESFEASISRLQQALTDAEDRTRDLAIVAGLEQIVAGEAENRPSETGAGGGYRNPAVSGSHDLSVLEDRAFRLDGQLDEVKETLENRLLLLRSTPMISPVRGVINSGFGFRRDPITGQRSHHDGIDISADRGQPILAPADGIVVRAERAGNLGRAVYVAHRFGYETRFGHLSRILVEEGQEVRRGDTLGWVGNSGRATGYHLHYEVRRDGDPRDPFEFLRDQG